MDTKEQELNKETVEEFKDLELKNKNEIYRRRWNLIIIAIITIFIILTLIVVYILKIKKMSIYNPYETKIINITSESKDWYANENINLFKRINQNAEKLIFPGDYGSYEFILNNTNNLPVYYNLKISEENKDRINIKYKLKLNNVYIIGDKDEYESIDKMDLKEIKIMENAKSLYTLEWKWEKSDNDLEIVRKGLATYRIYIDVYSKYR